MYTAPARQPSCRVATLTSLHLSRGAPRMQPKNDRNAQIPTVTRLVERWLTIQLTSDPRGQLNEACHALSGLAMHTAAQRFQALQAVLRHRPTLAAAARRLALVDQLELSLELVRGT